ncbi:YbaB/EbfC family nucleoid-associated protein [Candidatus Bealeia paramacronuclearis]|uniref:Nucleoid-associated protein Bealeia1_00425 n=1 Tax=Candidatus Bealeia paramacronuclearis TaxID=1921001 RepID=A0ABZ2C1B2_9PROT|nr:YbaB/EbfC family nucleoid-associated protein [Candidatus Bealeia paramacronuclearis]
MFGNIGDLMKKAQKMQKDMADVQDKLGELTVEGSAGGGMVKVVLSGKGDLKSLKIDPTLVDPSEIEMLEDLIIAAVNDGKSKAEALGAEEMKKITGGLKLPGGMSLPF